MASKDVKKLLKKAEAQGWRVVPTKSGHFWAYAPNGVDKVLVPGSPGDWRALENSRALMRQAGFKD